MLEYIQSPLGSLALAYTPYVLPYVLSAALLLLLAPFVWRRRATPGATAFTGALLAAAWWSLCNAGEISAISLSGKLMAVDLEYLAIPAVPALVLVSSLQYTGRWSTLLRRSCWALAIVPVTTLVLLWLPGHRLMRFDAALNPAGPTPAVSYGPWFYFSAFYNMVVMLAAIAVLIDTLSRSHGLFRAQSILLVAAAALPLVAAVAHVLKIGVRPFLDLTPPSFAVSAVILAFSVFRFRMFELVPAARDALVETITDAVLVIDRQGRIVDANPVAQSLFVCRSLLGQAAASLLPAEAASLLAQRQPGRYAVTLGEDGHARRFDMTVSTLRAAGDTGGWLVVLQDVSEREALIAELQAALNSIRTLEGLIPICAACKRVRDDQGYWQQVEAFVSARSRAEFSHGLCPDCIARIYPDDALDHEHASPGGILPPETGAS